jgi:hypothetical protein
MNPSGLVLSNSLQAGPEMKTLLSTSGYLSDQVHYRLLLFFGENTLL